MKKSDFEKSFEELLMPMIERCVQKIFDQNKEQTIENPNQWLSIAQASKEFGCTQFTLRNAMAKSEISYYQPENRSYIKRIDVYNYLDRLRLRSKDEIQDYPFLKE